jgi:hypothetical protein
MTIRRAKKPSNVVFVHLCLNANEVEAEESEEDKSAARLHSARLTNIEK